MSTKAPTTEAYDELDTKIDAFLAKLGAIFKVLLVLSVLGAFAYFVLIPNLETWGQYILFGLYLIFQLLFAILFMIIQFVALFWFLGRPRTFWVLPGETGVGFKDYKGNPEVLEAAKQVVTLLKGVKEFKAMGGQPIRGLLLIGPPGTGKSYLGQTISTEAGVPFGYLSAPSIQGMFWGMDVLRVWSLYRKARGLARKYGACILFIDEIDAIGRSRAGTMPGMGLGGLMFGGGSAALNQLLNEMEPMPRDTWKGKLLRKLGLKRGRAEDPPVLTIAATNLAEVLDPALLRPGRFDRKIVVDLPDATGRREILEYYLSKVKCAPDLPLDYMVADTIGYTPAAIKYVINEAVVHAHWSGRDAITYVDFRRAIENHEWGLRQPILGMSQEERRRIAYHEAGHAVAAVKLMRKERVEKATIVRHGSALGLVGMKPKEQRYTKTKDEYLADIQVSLASRAAEQLFLGVEMSGAHADLENATWVADLIIRRVGMNGSLVSAPALGEMAPDGKAKREIEKLLDQQFRKVKSLLEENREAVMEVAEALLEKEELMGDEIYEIVARCDARRAAKARANGQLALAEADGSQRSGEAAETVASTDGDAAKEQESAAS